MSSNNNVTGGKGFTRKVKEASASKAPEKKWVLFSKLYDHTAEIEQKYMNTPHYMTESGWLPDWGLSEAMRELLANMIDQSRKVLESSELRPQELQFTDAPGRLFLHVGDVLLAEARWKEKICMYVSSYVNGGVNKAKAMKGEYERVKTQCVELINYGSELPWKAFHAGYSSKRDSKTMIGKHGEGLTGACVVLNRSGCNISAECTHNGFTADVLNFESAVHFQLQRRKAKAKGDLPSCTVRFTVVFDPERRYPSPEQLMNSVRLSSTAAAAGIATSRGKLLLDPALRGKQFNRSIFVAEDAHCLFGYDFLDPDKNLLQGRDRNNHGKTNLVRECGAIISEAILQSEEVCEEVLDCFLYSARYDPNNPEQEELGQHEDLKDGKYLSSTAVDALRQHHSDGNDTVFCAQNSGKLREITEATGMNVVYSHRLLHNHVTVVDNFNLELVRDAQDITSSSRIYPHRDKLVALLKLGTARDTGLSEAQEIALNRTLQACAVPMESIVKILRLLRNQPDSSESPTNSSTARNGQNETELRANLAAKLLPRSTVASKHNQAQASTYEPVISEVSSDSPSTQTHSNPMNPMVNKRPPTQMGVTPEQREHRRRDVDAESDYSVVDSSCDDDNLSEFSEWEEESDQQDDASSNGGDNGSDGWWDRVLGRLKKRSKTAESVTHSESPSDGVSTPKSNTQDHSNNYDIDWTDYGEPAAGETVAKSTFTAGRDATSAFIVPSSTTATATSLTSAPTTAPPIVHVTPATSDKSPVPTVVAPTPGPISALPTTPSEVTAVPASAENKTVATPTSTPTPVQTPSPVPTLAPPQTPAPTTPAVSQPPTPLEDPAPDPTPTSIGTTATTATVDVATTYVGPQDAVEMEDDESEEADGDSEHSRLVATPVPTLLTPTDALRYVLPDPPASISLGQGRPSVYRRSRNAATGVWLYSDDDKKKANPSGRMAAQLEWCVPTPMDRHKLLLLSALVHIVVFSTSDASAALVFSSEGNCVCVNLSSEGINETVFKYFLRSQLKMYEFL
eukprot:gene7770-9278_t